MTVLRTGSMAPDAVVLAPAGPVRLSELWRDGPAVIGFFRHFGCPFCKDFIAQIREEHPRISGAGARVGAVFMGTPTQSSEFCAERALPFDCLADPDRSAYRAFAVATAGPTKWIASPRMIGPFLRVARRGAGVGLPHPGQDIRQMSATFVIGRDSVVRLAHYSRDASDNPWMSDVLGALGIG